jgi:hypothetical protein
VATLCDVVEVDERAGGRVDLLPVHGERRMPGEDEVDLLVPELLLRMVFDDLVTGVSRGVGVDTERRNAERLAHRLPDERAEDRDPLDVVEPKRLHPGGRVVSARLRRGRVRRTPDSTSRSWVEAGPRHTCASHDRGRPPARTQSSVA